MRLSFRFRWVPFVATVLLVVLGISLGNWQTRRANYKLSLQQQIEERSREAPLNADAIRRGTQPAEFRRVIADGQFIADWPLYLENRPLEGRAGFYLLMPFRLAASGDVVLVLRGWFPRDARDRTRIPDIAVPTGPLRIEGRVRADAGHVMQLGVVAPPAPRALLQNIEPGQFAAASGLPVHAFIIEQTSETADGLRRDWPQPSFGIDTHRGYAFQWYALAAAALLFFIATGIRRASKRNQAT